MNLIPLLKTWGLTLVIAGIAGVWTVYTFVYKEHILPSSQPSFLTVGVDLSRDGENDSFLAINAHFEVKNFGKRTAYTVPGIFVAWGLNLENTHQAGSSFVESANKVMESPIYSSPLLEQFAPPIEALKHNAFNSAEIIAVGPLFSDFQFYAQSTGKYSTIILVPKGKYDFLAVEARVPSISEWMDCEQLVGRWKIQNNDSYYLELYKLVGEEQFPIDPTNEKDWEFLDEIDMGESYAVGTISLWN